ncbi:cytochrome P450 [Nocardia sp. BMG111209]|uniref:cytochrome P450 n=1 Tax=Nocardia sp. BMG111209 TaxID=1160137 RepID=UPI00037581D0|nr:cytochrome P450 [Nocardia sp. BMG111209]
MTSTDATRLSDDWCQHHFDHLSPELAADMHPTMARMRELCPVAHSDSYDGFWVVSRYDDALAVAQNWQAFSSAHGLSVTSGGGSVRNLPVEADPPVQRLYKSLINPHFTPAVVAEWEQPTRELVTRLIDEFIEAGTCDFMDAFARPFPSLGFFELAINAPADEMAAVAKLASTSSNPTAPNARESWAGLYAWVRNFLATRREQPPKGDVVDAVIAAEIEGRPIGEDEAIGVVQLLILGGLETTAGALGQMLVRFCREPEIPALLRERPSLIPKAVEELLRLDTSFVSVGRTAVQDAEVGGCPIGNGDKVLIHWASANRDAAEFPDPDRFDLDRTRNRHFAFGAGPHRCAGSNLARLNIRIALEEILTRLGDIALVDEDAIVYHAGLTRTPLHLPISFTPGARLG